MPVILNLPTTVPSSQSYLDQVKVYKRVDAYGHTLLSTEALGTATYTDAGGLIGDEYHVTFASSTLSVESLPSNIYRAGPPWTDAMGVILELETTSPNPAVDQVGVYRRQFSATTAIRLGTVSLGTQYYNDPAGQPGDEYHTTFINSVTLDESQPGPSVIADADSGLVVVSGMFQDIRGTGVTKGPGVRDPLGQGPHLDIELIWTKRHVAPTANGRTIARTHYDVTVQANGMWSVPLVPNDLILNTDAYYEFTFSDGEKYHKRVKSDNGLAQNFGQLEDVDPVYLR